MNRKVINKVIGFNTQDGAGVKLVRVLSNRTVKDFDPILMLDSFDSLNAEDYTKGFPMHPHRGIETISYLVSGKMTHKDSIGNNDTITNGEVQWMTAGSGIMHEELLPPVDRILGVQLWLNLPRKNKMVQPKYNAIKNKDIQEIDIEVGILRLLAGEYKNYKGYKSDYLPLDYYDIILKPNSTFSLETSYNRSIMLFTLEGDVEVEGKLIPEKTAVKLSLGDQLVVNSKEKQTHLLYISSETLNESVAWGGPIVMNTREELNNAFIELRNGTFIKESIDY
ncbi:MAG: pirin family protein [Bacteroidales bacterium]|jgi:redox-sensitive bicupin YhaK (pirin superfamily)